MGLEVGTYISDLVITNPVGATDPKSQGDDHLRLIKATIRATFPNLNAAMTSSPAELNILDGATLSTAELNILDGVTLTAAQINDAARLSVANTFTDIQTFTTNIVSQSIAPIIDFYETDAATDEKSWRITNSSGQFRIRTFTDAGTGVSNALLLDRNGTTVTEVELNATLLDFNGNLDISGTSLLTGAVTASSTLTVSGGALIVTGALPYWNLTESDAAADNQKWFAYVNGTTLAFSAATDAEAHDNYMTVARSGGTVTGVTLDATTLTFNGTAASPNTSAAEVGFKGVPVSNQSADYTLVLTDAAKCIQAVTNSGIDFTVPVNATVAFPIGTVISFSNISAGTITIASAGADTIALAGTSDTGTRTLAVNGLATMIKVTAQAWIISGTGLS